MELKEKQNIHGFEVDRIRESRELHGRMVMMTHRKTGARLFHVDNGAENMVFSIAFRTLPEDSTGVFHILEHSVLCGSGKYPVREPFVELMKSSMNTFLNAMTFPDMTMYPVASRNPRDLLNLAGVYLDAVFDPEVIRDPKRFCQEGWHIDRDEEGRPVYKGVVFNEMKGAMSDTDTLIDRQMVKQLFPDTCYGFNSGGDPEVIPSLTFEKFREQYERHYHPSNAWIYLDGNVPLDELLGLIDSYLSRYDRREEGTGYILQQPVGSEQTIRYELGQEEEEKNRGHLSLGRLAGTWKNRDTNTAIMIIGDVLTGNNEAPLKRAALERGLAQNLTVSIDDSALQSWVMIHAENVTDGKESEILDLLKETGETIRENGLDRNAVEASLNRVIYNLREEDEPQGIGRCIRCMEDWMYGGDPGEALESEELVRRLKEMLDDGTFDRLAEDILLNREGTAILHTLPSVTVGEEKRLAEAERLDRIVSGWTEEEKAENDRLIDELEAWQQTPDSAEALSTLPRLKKEDADVTPEWIESGIDKDGDVTILKHEIPCNDVVHMRAYFTLSNLTLEEITGAALLTTMLGKLPTTRHDALTLQQEIRRYTGALSFCVVVKSMPEKVKTCSPYLVASCSALKENAEKAQELLAEILTKTRLDQTDRIIEMIQQNELSVRQRVISAGTQVAVRQAMSRYSAEGAVKNALDGAPAVRYLHRIAKNPDRELDGFLELGKRIIKETFCRKRMTVSVTADEYLKPDQFLQAFGAGTEIATEAAYREESARTIGYRIPAQISFAARGYQLRESGKCFSGIMWLASSILSLEYLWNKIRVQGGAYGAGMQVDRMGSLFTYSFRDPTPGKTLTADAGAAAFLKEFAKQGDGLDKYIISSLNELNPLMGPKEKGMLADLRYLCGYTREMNEKTRKEILYATPEQLAAFCEVLEDFAEKGSICVVGYPDALESCGLETTEDL